MAEASPAAVIIADRSTTDLPMTARIRPAKELARFLYRHQDRHGRHGLHVPRHPAAGPAVPVHPLAEAAGAAEEAAGAAEEAAEWAGAAAVPAEEAAPADEAGKCLFLAGSKSIIHVGNFESLARNVGRIMPRMFSCQHHIVYARGNPTVITVPTPSSLSRLILPPRKITPCLTIESPRPVPPICFEWLLSTL